MEQMNIMPVIPTVNNKNNCPQNKPTFKAMLTPKSEKFIEKQFGVVGQFRVTAAITGIRSRLKNNPLVEITPAQDVFQDGTTYLVNATHQNTTISKSTSVPDYTLDTLIETIKVVSNDLVDALNRMGK